MIESHYDPDGKNYYLIHTDGPVRPMLIEGESPSEVVKEAAKQATKQLMELVCG